MSTLKLKDDIYWIGILDHKLRVFDIIMETKFGTTYNSYLVKGSEKTVLVETAKAKFFDDYLNNIEEYVSISDIDYIVLDHTEPDHTGSVEKILDMNPNITIIGSKGAIQFVEHIINRSFNSMVVKSGDSLDLGNKTMEFISAPKLHWPDSIYTYIPEDKVLFTCDSFGSHYCLDSILQSTIENQEDYMEALKYYFDMILGPFKASFLRAIDKIKDLEIDMVCTGHGPVLDSDPWKIINQSKEWSTEVNPNKNKTVVIAYVSAYGYTEEMAQHIAEGIKSEDVDAVLYDLTNADIQALAVDLYWANGILLGSPTILCDALKPVWDLTTTMFPEIHGGKFASAFGSYGWSGEAVPNLMTRLKQLRMRITDEGYQLRFKPSVDEIKGCFEFGKQFAEKIANSIK